MKSKRSFTDFKAGDIISISKLGKIKSGNDSHKGAHFAEVTDDNN